ncbi:protoporphyrinogen oxidase HemJ [Hankyongella ginsenosidimutans]|uniref:Protoporphyrinogen IX oxidase n=1 Tax=Hankyongella ginsenosidimutans TaxID=1763828 RepID=A0A4D7C2S6_9SPHN|nr:protoporphyrinogen oxidase HemJ [Hankyongella ginsenosidimutans]QCI79371.1 protoporphyrinogen oxidase HemJ [Hankyongella ginsenosidimutans]TXG83499.1 MAG: protoporphyrinogen oxidase HemJ [Sphingomonadales bacterium]
MLEPGWLGGAYLWIKALHVIFVIFWMAGMFILPRYFAYHSECAAGSAEDRLWQVRESRLLRIIINPSMAFAWLFGLALAFHLGFADNGWLHLKLALVLALSGYHGLLARWRKDFVKGVNTRSSRFYRIANEIPTLAVIPIVILVIVKPF